MQQLYICIMLVYTRLTSNAIATRNNLFIATMNRKDSCTQRRYVWPVTELCCCTARRVVLSKACVQNQITDTVSMHIHLAPPANAPATWCPQSQYITLTHCIFTQLCIAATRFTICQRALVTGNLVISGDQGIGIFCLETSDQNLNLRMLTNHPFFKNH
jgi:hypothetical protein